MTIYKSFDELNGKTLQLKDTVSFGPGLTYKVICNSMSDRPYLNHVEDSRKVFDHLGVTSSTDIIKLAEQVYGYKYIAGYFPEAAVGDYEGLTRLALALYAAVDGDDYVELKIKGKFRKIDLSAFKYEPPVKIRVNKEYEGEFKSKGFVVGCQTIKYEQLKKIVAKAKQLSYL